MAANQEGPAPQGSPDPLILTPLTRRNHPPDERSTLPPDIEEQLNHLRESILALSAHFLGETEPPTESLKERGARRIKKFHRASGDERPATTPGDETATEAGAYPGDEMAPGPDETADRLARNKHIAWPRRADTEPASQVGEGTHRWWQGRPTLGVLLGAQALALLLLAAGYLLGHFTSVAPGRAKGIGNAKGDLFGSPEMADQALHTADEALGAEHSGDLDKARKIYETAVNRHVPLGGMNYRLALLAVQRNDRLEAEQRLERSMQDGESVADCCYLSARLAADKGDYDEAADQFQRATFAQPFAGKQFFYRGELLRRQGKPQAAVAAFQQALERPYNVESGDLYLFKQRLARAEFGRDDAFNAELASRLKQTPVSGEWLLLAAAQELERQEYPAAAEHLRLASERMPAFLYATLTHDYLFQTHAKRSEVSALLSRTANADISSAGPSVLDPGSWLPQRGDPAIWATATK